MDTLPLVSTIIPTYNAEKWIRETVDSVLAQTYSPVEIIVVDDGSKDGTRAILSTYGDRIRVIENDINQGVSISRNIAIDNSKGDYIALLDHDDLWHPQKLEKQMSLFNSNPRLGLVYCDAYYEKGGQDRWRSFQINQPFRGITFDKLLEHNFVLCLTAVIPRRVLMQVRWFHPDLNCGEDYDLFLRIAERFPIDFVDEPLATYRVHAENYSHRIDIRYTEWIQILLSHRARRGVYGSIAMVYVRWGRDAWRSEGRFFKGLAQVLKGLVIALRDPIGFFKAFREAWRQKLNAQSKKKIHIPV